VPIAKGEKQLLSRVSPFLLRKKNMDEERTFSSDSKKKNEKNKNEERRDGVKQQSRKKGGEKSIRKKVGTIMTVWSGKKRKSAIAELESKGGRIRWEKKK